MSRSTSISAVALRAAAALLFFSCALTAPTFTAHAAPQRQSGTVDLWIGSPPFGGVAVQGEQYTYTLSWSNYSMTSATGVVVTDSLPSDVTFVSATPTPTSVSGNVLTWNAGTVSAYTGGSATIVVQITGPAGTTITNTASISSAETDSNPGNNYVEIVRSVVAPVRDVQAWKALSVFNGSFLPGWEVRYQLSAYSGYGANAAAHNVVVTDTLPPGMEFVSASSSFTFTQNGNTLMWELGTVPATGSNYPPIEVVARILTDTLPGTVLTNTATVSTSDTDANPSNNTATASFTVVAPTRDLQVTKMLDSSSRTPLAGQLLTYTLSLVNNGNSTATNVVLTDTLPFDASSLVSVDGPLTYTLQGNNLVWNIGYLNTPAYLYPRNFLVTVRVPVGASAGTVITNTATATMAESDANPADNTAIVTATVEAPSVGLYIQKSSPTTSATRGQWVTYTLNYGIAVLGPFGYGFEGNSDAMNVRITDTLPAGTSFVTSTAPVAPVTNGNSVVWSVGTVQRGFYWYSFLVTLKVNDDAFGGTVNNIASIGSDEYELSPSNNITTATLYIDAPLLTRGVVASAPASQTLSAGSSASLSFSVINTGNTTDTFTLAYTQTKPWANFAAVPASITLAPGATGYVNIPLSVPANLAATSADDVRLTATSQGDGSKTATARTTVTGTAASTVIRGVAVAVPAAQTASSSSALTLTFTVTNTGNAADTLVLHLIQDTTWANFAGLPATVTLAAGASTTVSVPVDVPSTARLGDVDAIYLTATSQNDLNKTITGSTTITINKIKVFLPVIRNGEPE